MYSLCGGALRHRASYAPAGGDRLDPILERAEPRIVTDRLMLRRYRESDFEPLRRMAAAPEMFRYSERGAMLPEEAWARLLRHVGHWDLLGYGVFAVEERATGRFIGEAGIADFRRGLGPDFDSFPESTWSIAPEAQRHGYASEAAGAALAWVSRLKLWRQTVCLIHVDNEPSLSVAQKLGYRAFKELEYRGYPARLLKRIEHPQDRD